MRAVLPLSAEDLDYVLAHTEALWAELRGQRLFITGGTGFFGIWLLETFAYANSRLALGAEATVLTRDPHAFAAKVPHLAGRADIKLIRGDVRSFDFPAGIFSHVIHAGTTSSAPVAPLEMFDTITGGTRRVLDFAAQSGAHKLLFTSSGAVYGPQPTNLSHMGEDYMVAPDAANTGSAYGEGKRAAELLCTLMAAQHGFESKIARCFAFVGPHLALDAHFAIGNFIGDVLANRAIRVAGDPATVRSYLYAADLAVWLWTILFRGASARPYNVGSSAAMQLGEVAEIVRDVAGSSLETVIERREEQARSVYVPDVTRARQELSLPEPLTLHQSVARTLAWHRQAALVRA